MKQSFIKFEQAVSASCTIMLLIFIFNPLNSWGQITTTSHLGSPISITGFPKPVCGDQVAVYTCKSCWCCPAELDILDGQIQRALQNAPLDKRVRVEYDKVYDFSVLFSDLSLAVKVPYPLFDSINAIFYFDIHSGVDGQKAKNGNERLVRDPDTNPFLDKHKYNGSVKFSKGTKDGYLAIRYIELDPTTQAGSLWFTTVVIPFVVEGPAELNVNVPIIDTIQEPQLPYLVLHAPPGDQSFTEFKSGKTTCRQTQTSYAESQSSSTNLAVKLGFASTLGLFVTTKVEFSVTFSAGFESGDMVYVQTQDQTCITVNESFKTSEITDDKGGGDVFIGYGSDLGLGLYPLISVNEATCSVVRDSGLIYGRIPGSLREFALTRSGIEAKIADLEAIVSDSSNLVPRTTNNAQNQIDVWHQVLAMNLANINNPNNELIGAPFELDSRVEKVREESITVSAITTIEYEQYIQAKVGVQAKIEVAGSGVSGGFEYKASTRYGQTQNQSNETSKLVKYTLKDDDLGDIFNLQIVRDPMFGTPIFRMDPATRTSCPYQGRYQRDQPKLTSDDGSQEITLTDIPNGGTGLFQLKICNDSDEPRTYYLKGNSNTNLDGAIVEGFGNNLFNTNDDGIEFYLIPAHDCLNTATLSIKQANTAIRDYENIELYLNVNCQPATAPITSSIFLSAHFGATAVADFNKEGVSMRIVPNPNDGQFKIQFEKELKEGHLFLTDITGKRVYEKVLEAGKTFIEINQENLHPGIYMLVVQSGDAWMNQKLVIER